MSDADYLYTWMKIVLPLAYSFNPDIIFVSAGFDAGIHDPLGKLKIFFGFFAFRNFAHVFSSPNVISRAL